MLFIMFGYELYMIKHSTFEKVLFDVFQKTIIPLLECYLFKDIQLFVVDIACNR